MSRPNLLTLDTWSRHERAVLEVFCRALERLENAPERLPEDEAELNRKLFFLAKKENHNLRQAGRGLSSTPFPDSPNLPLEEDPKSRSRESKRPDFQCGLIDDQTGKDLIYAIECKRLGHPSSPRWVLNKNYTSDGVRRFIDPDYGYGEGATSGAMIGYLQSMPPETVLQEVNEFAAQADVPAIQRATGQWIDRGVSRLDQMLARRVWPSPFALTHLWVDLRHRYN